MPRVKKDISEAQRKKDPHAGPGESYPEDAKHLAAAWDLAGHAKTEAEKESIRRKVLAYARQHNMEHLLPDTAKEHLRKSHDDAWTIIEDVMMKAKTSDVQDLFNMAWQHENDEGDRYEKQRLVHFADEHGMLHLLPDQAHSTMHELNIGHNHDGVENDEDGTHQHPVTKAYNPVTFSGTIEKSWSDDTLEKAEENDVFYEGWLSTPTRDTQKDIVEPEAFVGSIPGYFLRRAPVSVKHGTEVLPAGHLMKAVVMRDGKTLLEVDHPSDKGQFTARPSEGSGVWVLGRLTEDPAKGSVRKGNCGGMSFIGNGVEFTPLPGGGKRYTRINPVMETTVAPYPVNTEAFMAVIKAFGLEEEQTKESFTTMPEEKSLEQMLLEAAEHLKAKEEAQQNVAKSLTKEEIAAMIVEANRLNAQAQADAVQKAVSEQVTAVFEAMRAQPGSGKQSTIKKSEADLRDEDPIAYVLSKANTEKGHEDLSFEDKDFIAGFTKRALFDGLKD